MANPTAPILSPFDAFWNRLPQLLLEDIPQLDAKCSVCLDPYKEAGVSNEVPMELPCGHVFGDICLRRWLEQHNTCMICRRELFTLPQSEEDDDEDDMSIDDSDAGPMVDFIDDDESGDSQADWQADDSEDDFEEGSWMDPHADDGLRDQEAHRDAVQAQIEQVTTSNRRLDPQTAVLCSEFVRILLGEKPDQTQAQEARAFRERARLNLGLAHHFGIDIDAIHPADPLESEIMALNGTSPGRAGHFATELESTLFARLNAERSFVGSGFEVIKRKRGVSIFRIFNELMAEGVYWNSRSEAWVTAIGGFFPDGLQTVSRHDYLHPLRYSFV